MTNNYEKMTAILNNTDLHAIAFADFADNASELAFYIDGIKTLTVTVTYDDIDSVMDFCDDIENYTDGNIKALDVFDDILNGYVDVYVDVEIEHEDERGHIWYTTERYEIEGGN